MQPNFLNGVPRADALQICKTVSIKSFDEGCIVFEQGQPSDGYYFMVAGSAFVYMAYDGQVPDGAHGKLTCPSPYALV